MPALDVAALRRALAMTAAAGLAYACASAHAKRSNDDAPHPVYVEVQNDLTIPAVISTYVLEGVGIRIPLGDIGGGQVKSFTFTPESFGQQYRLVAYRQLSRPIYSAPFIIESPVTGTIVWSVYTGIVTFRDRDVVETTYTQTNHGAIRVGGGDTTKPAVPQAAPQGVPQDTTRDSTKKNP
jgi:hypothetical protein